MKSTLLTATIILCSAGCATSLVEKSALEDRVISQFVAAVDEENEAAVRRVSSTQFEQKALRSKDVMKDLEIVDLPTGELSIVEVNKPSETQRNVVVEDTKGTRYRFDLVRDDAKKRWAVDDVLVRQKKKWKKTRLTATRPTSEVLDLVFSVREFLDAWEKSDSQQILTQASPALAASIEGVPDAWLEIISKDIGERYDPALARKPEAQLTDSSAVVRIPVRGGSLLVTAIQQNDRWLIDDIEIHQRSESGHPGSIRRQADAVGGLSRFLNAFEAEERPQLKQCATESFYDGTLQFADLSLVRLPSTTVTPDEFNVRAFSGRVTIMVPTARDIVRFDMIDPDLDQQKLVAREGQQRRFLVDHVILYDRSRQNERTLASVFTAPARATLFIKALATQDIPVLRQLSTLELNTAVWTQVSDDQLAECTLPLDQLKNMTLADSSVHGGRTKLSYRTQGGSQVICLMNEESGRLLMDDFHFSGEDHQALSLRTQVSLQIPIVAFKKAWKAQDLDGLQKASSTEFNRLVLSHLKVFPEDVNHLGNRLDTLVRSTRVTDRRATVELGLSARPTAEVHLVHEHDRWAINDVSIPESAEHTVELRRELRSIVANQMLNRGVTQSTAIASSDRPPTESITVVPVPRPPVVDVVRQASVLETDSSTVTQATFEAFAPDPNESSAQLNKTSPHADFAEPPELTPVPNDMPLSPVPPQLATDKEDGQFLHFGPQADKQAAAPAAASPNPTPRAFSLADKPVPIDSPNPTPRAFSLADKPVPID